jgi:hypothetical protein
MESGTGSGNRKRAGERGPLAQQKRQKVEPEVEEVPAYTYRVQRLGGDGINLTLAKPRVSGLELKQAIAREEGISVCRQELYLVAIAEDGSAVREDDAEPVLYSNEDEVECEQTLTLSVESDKWEIAGPSVNLSETNALASFVLNECVAAANPFDERKKAESVKGSEHLESGRHYWEVEIASAGKENMALQRSTFMGEAKNIASTNDGLIGLCIGIAKPSLALEGSDLDDDDDEFYEGDDATRPFFMITGYCGGLWGNAFKLGANDIQAGAYQEGDRVGVLLDLDDGSLQFFKNGKLHGPGYPAGSVAGPVVRAALLQGHAGDSQICIRLLDAPFPESATTSTKK